MIALATINVCTGTLEDESTIERNSVRVSLIFKVSLGDPHVIFKDKILASATLY